jgi:dihydrodipicolinate synthase/N-acetylneuraminate lyase
MADSAIQAAMQGVFPILLTPFDDQDRVDQESLRSEVEYAIAAGVHGVGIALGSEMPKLTEAEREMVVKTVVDETGGRVPVVVNSGAQASYPAVVYGRRAQELGASALMSIPPTGASASEVRSYFRALSDAVRIPIFVQDVGAWPVPAALIRAIAEECEHVRYAKIESAPQPVRISDSVTQCQGLVTIFGGAGGTFLVEELRRGSAGTMPFPTQLGSFVAVWDRFHSGDLDGAREVFGARILPLLRIASGGMGMGHLVHKEVLRRKGVIGSARVRAPADPMDEMTRGELDEFCDCVMLD